MERPFFTSPLSLERKVFALYPCHVLIIITFAELNMTYCRMVKIILVMYTVLILVLLIGPTSAQRVVAGQAPRQLTSTSGQTNR